MNGDDITLQVLGMRLAARTHGPPDGMPVLALHGWLDNAASFDALAPLLPGMRVVALDLPGHGLSQHRGNDAFYHFVDWVPIVAAAADELGWARYSLLGHSMGGAIACLVAGALTAAIDKVVLIEGLGPASSPAEEMPERLALAVEELRRRRRPSLRMSSYPDIEAMAQALCAALGRIEARSARRLVERGSQPAPDGNGLVWRADKRLRGTSPMRLSEDHVRAFLAGIAAPVLLIQADEGMHFDAEVMRGRFACIRQAELSLLPGGHHVHMDDPTAVAAVVLPFLRGAR